MYDIIVKYLPCTCWR